MILKHVDHRRGRYMAALQLVVQLEAFFRVAFGLGGTNRVVEPLAGIP